MSHTKQSLGYSHELEGDYIMVKDVNEQKSEMRILIATAVTVEKEAVLRGLHGDNRFEVIEVGVGPAAAASRTAKALSEGKYNLVVSAGIGGGFVDQAEVGSLVVASEIAAADLGAETPGGFCGVDELGFGSTRIPVDHHLAMRMVQALRSAGCSVQMGPVLTVSTVTGTQETAMEMARRVPGAAAEAMEGFGVATAAQDHGVPIVEIRAISNPIGPRDRASWRIPDALHALETASKILLEVFV